MVSQNNSENKLLALIKTTFIGGALVILPAYLGVLVVNKMLKGIIVLIPAFLKPLTKLLGIEESYLATPIALIIFLLLCLITGVILKSNYATFFKEILEPIFKKIPGYLLLRRIINQAAKIEQVENLETAFVALGETYQALTPAFVIQKHSNDYYTIFIPNVPTPTIGNLYIITGNRVFPVDIPLLDMVKFISRWGEASPELLKQIEGFSTEDFSKPAAS